MKTDKKTNELNCIAGATVKEEPCSESCATQDHATGNNCEKLEDEDSKNCNKDSKLNGMTRNNNTPAVKVEATSCYVSCSLSAGSKLETKAVRNTGAAGESQYMQQQSQIFVFSTMLANKGAEAVLRGQFPSIVAYHSAQLSTKKFLEKFPNKSEKCCKKSTDWLNNLTGNGQKNPPTGTRNDSIRQVPVSDVSPFWTDNPINKNGGSMQNSSGNNESSVDDTINKVVNSQSSPRLMDNTICSAASSLQTLVQGVKVPDENLTPQQRQHREEQLATIRNMRMLLFSNRPAETVTSLETGQSVKDMVPEGMNSLANSPLDNFSSGVDWDKIQSQLFDVKNKEEVAEDSEVPTSCSGQFKRTSTPNQGAPPSYHSTSRPASVPVGLRNSNPSSPNDPTSTLSLPSPRRTSAVNSPGESNRQYQSGNQRSGYLPEDRTTAEGADNHSEPGTPASHPHLVAFSPAAAPAFQKDSTIDFASAQSPSVDDILCQTLESVSHEHQEHVASVTASQEANLMPVPSPQQIQYLHSFDGQELTIQKQPNNGLKEEASTIDAATGHLGNKRLSDVANSCASKLERSSPISENMERAFPGPMPSPRTPTCSTPNASMDSSTNIGTSRVSTDMANSSASYNQILGEDRGEARTVRESPLPLAASPPVTKEQRHAVRNNDCRMTVRFMGQNYAHGRVPVSARRPEHLPLNPNSDASSCQVVRGNLNNNDQFDPISSLAQMSQQFANVSSNTGEVQMHSGNGAMMDPQGMHLEITQDMHGSRMLVQRVAGFGEFGGPNPGMPQPSYQQSRSTVGLPERMRHPSPAYGPVNPASYPHAGQLRPIDHHQAARPNVQVKPGAPNTIQYLPAKPNVNSGMPRGPPSLDFLQNFGVPATNLDPRIPTMQNPRYSNPVGQNPVMHGPYPGMGRLQRPVEYTPMYPPPNAARGMMPHPQANSQRMHHVVAGPAFHGSRPNLDKPFPDDAIPHMNQMPNRMYVPANRGCAPGLRHRPPQPGAPGGNNFKPTPFVRGLPPGSDPNYAQQYHSFQQQLYATGSRHSLPTSQLNPHLATNSPTFLPDR